MDQKEKGSSTGAPFFMENHPTLALTNESQFASRSTTTRGSCVVARGVPIDGIFSKHSNLRAGKGLGHWGR